MNTSSESLCLSHSSTAVVSSPKSILRQRKHTKPTVHGETTADALRPVLQSCQRRIRSWRVPPNWSPGGWFEEIEAVEAIAAWQAGCAYDPSSGINYQAFVYQKVMARALTRYRQEWTYALRVISTDECTSRPRSSNAASDSAGSADRGDIPLCGTSVNTAFVLPIFEDLDAALTTLSKAQQQLIKNLFWHTYSEARIGKALGVSQRAISKRKHVILKLLRHRLSSNRAGQAQTSD